MEGPVTSKVGTTTTAADADDFDLSKLLDKPRLKIERKRSFDERSFSELTINVRQLESYDSLYSPGYRSSGIGTPLSARGEVFDPDPMVGEAWESLRRSLVYFKGQPVGTIAAYDHASEEVLNYDQVNIIICSFI
jgi:Alkaline and neutral invertase